jgi:uncharacterized protein YjbJ (UPF0337 family)
MNKDRLKGTVEKIKGAAKEAAGTLTGNKQKQAEGFAERAHGATRERVAKIDEEAKRDLEDSEIIRQDE